MSMMIASGKCCCSSCLTTYISTCPNDQELQVTLANFTPNLICEPFNGVFILERGNVPPFGFAQRCGWGYNYLPSPEYWILASIVQVSPPTIPPTYMLHVYLTGFAPGLGWPIKFIFVQDLGSEPLAGCGTWNFPSLAYGSNPLSSCVPTVQTCGVLSIP